MSKTKETAEEILIAPPNIKTGEVWIKGTAPLVIHAWSKKVQEGIKAKQEAVAARPASKEVNAVFGPGGKVLKVEGGK